MNKANLFNLLFMQSFNRLYKLFLAFSLALACMYTSEENRQWCDSM